MLQKRGELSSEGRGRRETLGVKGGRGSRTGPDATRARSPPTAHSPSAGRCGVRRGPAAPSGASKSGSSPWPFRHLALRRPAAARATCSARHVQDTCGWRKCTCSPPWGGGSWIQGVVKTRDWPGLGLAFHETLVWYLPLSHWGVPDS